MEPVRVKIYGLTSMTRRGYLTQLGVAVMLVIGLLAFWWFWPAVRPDPKTVPDAARQRVLVFLDNVPWVVGIIGVLLLLEAWIVLRRFAARKRNGPGSRW